jgi:hypothetical protein
MNKLEDAPHLQAAFEKAGQDFGLLFAPKSYRITAEHFFIAGRDSLREECESVKPVKAKRYIDRVMFEGKETYAISNDGRLYCLVREAVRWVEYPNLPQD